MSKIVKIALDIPSGKLVCGNDFRNVFCNNWREEVNHNVNNLIL